MNPHEQSIPRTAEEFMARACALEAEAAERYAELAELMRAHHNAGVAELFGKLARIEGLHRDKILVRMGWDAPPDAGAFRWRTPEGPETTDFADLHYLMTPWHALKLAEHNEIRAAEFFEQLASQVGLPPDLRSVAAENATEEREHVALIRAWLARVPEPRTDWAEDTDPPNAVD